MNWSSAVRWPLSLAFLAMLCPFAFAYPGETRPVSVGLPGFGPLGDSYAPSVSLDGRYVAFDSDAPDFVPGDMNAYSDVFVRDLTLGTNACVSVDPMGVPAAGWLASISASGRFIAFESPASNLTPGDTNGRSDVFVRDMMLGVTVRVSVGSTGGQGNDNSYDPAISADGRWVAFKSLASNLVAGDTNGVADIFVHDVKLRTTLRVSVSSSGDQANGESDFAAISSDGLHVAFESKASNLVAGDTNGHNDVFVRDLTLGTTTLVSAAPAGGPANERSYKPSVSADGRFVAFESIASNLVDGDSTGRSDVFVRDVALGTTWRASLSSSGEPGDEHSYSPSISADGRHVAFASLARNFVAGDTNARLDVFIRDCTLGTTTRVSVDTAGTQANDQSESPSISGDGQVVAFRSRARNLVPIDTNDRDDVYVRNVPFAATSRIESVGGQANEDAWHAAISADGRYVAFGSSARNLVPGDTNGCGDVFVRDLAAGTTTLVSANTAGGPANGDSDFPCISADGRYVAFSSRASNLVAGASNGRVNIFVRDMTLGTTSMVSLSSLGLRPNADSSYPSISADGRYVEYDSAATNIVDGITTGHHVYVRDRELGITTCASVSSSGVPGNNGGRNASLSADGRYVAFSSGSTNLVPGDANSMGDVFVRDRVLGTTTLVSLSTTGAQGNRDSFSPSISVGGRYVAFESTSTNLVANDTNGRSDIFVRDMQTGITSRASVSSSGAQANSDSRYPALSADGQFVTFETFANNLVAGDTNGKWDVLLRDIASSTTSRVSESHYGTPGSADSRSASISADGSFVAFESRADNLTATGKRRDRFDVFRHEFAEAATTVSGTIVLNDYTGPRASPGVVFELEPVMSGSPQLIGPLSTDQDGSYEFTTTEAGIYNLYAKASTFLRRKHAGTVTLGAGPVGGVDFVLINGDVDGSNAIDLDDFLILAANYEADPLPDLRPDLNGDGAVNLDDFLILAANYEVTGD